MNAWILNPSNKIKYLLQTSMLGIGVDMLGAEVLKNSISYATSKINNSGTGL